MKLYAIASDIAAICDTEELSPDVEKQLDALALSLESKVDGCCRLMREWQTEAERFTIEASRLSLIAAELSGRTARLREYVQRCLDLAGVTKLETELFRLSIVKNSRPSIRVREGDPIPAEYLRITESLDGAAAYESWKAGEELPPSLIVEQGSHMRIR